MQFSHFANSFKHLYITFFINIIKIKHLIHNKDVIMPVKMVALHV